MVLEVEAGASNMPGTHLPRNGILRLMEDGVAGNANNCSFRARCAVPTCAYFS